jgi:hypothetical protein
MKPLKTFEQFSTEIADPQLNERVEFFELAQRSRSKEDFRVKVIDQLQKVAPGLASDENFVDQIVDTYPER